VADGADPKTAVDIVWLAVGVGLAYLAGMATRPVIDRATTRLHVWVNRRRASQREVLEAVQRLLPELQKAAEASADADGYRHCLSLNLEAIGLRDRIATPRIREAVERYQHDALDVAEFLRGETERGPLVGVAGEVSGESALGRVHSLLVARQAAWESLAQVLARISGELRRL
jgi:heme exporter protein D